MATKPWTPRRIGDALDMQSVAWSLADGDDGAPFEAPDFADRSVQIRGTLGGATIIIEGSNEVAPTTYATLTDPSGMPLSFTAASLRQVVEITRHIRPRVSGGSTVSVVVELVARR